MYAPVLVVGQAADAVRRTRDDFISGGLINPVTSCEDSQDSAAYVLGLGEYARRDVHPLPAVVVTELRLPLGSGLDVLRTVRSHLTLRSTPVIVIGGDPDDQEIAELHRAGATAYLSASVASCALLDVIRGLNMPWSIDRLEAQG